jgi:hypothetical protein
MIEVACVDCARRSLPADGLLALHGEGWRSMQGEGAQVEWRCADCWPVFREAMGEAAHSSTRFRAAATVEAREVLDARDSLASLDLERSGERVASRGAAPEDTQPESRSGMLRSAFRAIFATLARMPTSPRVLALTARADAYHALVLRWRGAAPSRQEQEEVFEAVSKLHAVARSIEAARERSAR